VNAPDRSAARPADERLRECGLDLITRLLALVRIGRSYQVDNQVFRQQLHTFLEALAPALADEHEAALISLDDDLYLNGVRLPVRTSNLRFHQALMQELTRRRIAGVRILDGATETELAHFFRLFLQPGAYNGPALLEACTAAGVTRVLPALHASTQFGEDADPLDAGDGGDGANGTGSGGEAGEAEPTRSDPIGPRPVARKTYSLALLGARSVLSTTVLQEGMPLSRAKRVVQPLIDGALSGESVLLGLSAISHHDEYTYAHAVGVCLVAVTIGRVLGLARRDLADLGVAALLHDVGKAAVYGRIHHPLEQFDDEDRRLAESHTLEGTKLIAHATTLNAATLCCMQVALEHHVGRTTDGYPALPEGWPVSRLSEIVSIADCFASMQAHRGERGRTVTPYEALGMVLGPHASRFDPALTWALVRALGFYPPGQIVELSDGRTAFVLAPNPDDPARPHVRTLPGADGTPAEELHPLSAELAVTRALPATEYPDLPIAA
jgi:HD-GYP domain-containing protein (c-di-GMP phosphodiesterase class II)